MKKFKPMLASNEQVDLDNIRYPKYASCKLDGIRVVFHPELGMVSRSLKPIPNKQLNEKFQFLVDKSKELNRVFDGELYGHSLTFQHISRAVMTKDFTDEKTVKKLKKELPDDVNVFDYALVLISKIKFYCFETYSEIPEKFMFKDVIMKSLEDERVVVVKQIIVNHADDVKALFSIALGDGYEGLILRCPLSLYKFGRSTLKEEWMLKVKPFEDFDAKIIGVEQATKVDPNAKKKTNELGRSVTSQKKGDRILIEKASAFLVLYNGLPVKVSLAMPDIEKQRVWKHREDYIGRMIEYKGMLVGAKDVPRHPVFVRFRDDKDE